jgi:hypothetical protein
MSSFLGWSSVDSSFTDRLWSDLENQLSCYDYQIPYVCMEVIALSSMVPVSHPVLTVRGHGTFIRNFKYKCIGTADSKSAGGYFMRAKHKIGIWRVFPRGQDFLNLLNCH